MKILLTIGTLGCLSFGGICFIVSQHVESQLAVLDKGFWMTSSGPIAHNTVIPFTYLKQSYQFLQETSRIYGYVQSIAKRTRACLIVSGVFSLCLGLMGCIIVHRMQAVLGHKVHPCVDLLCVLKVFVGFLICVLKNKKAICDCYATGLIESVLHYDDHCHAFFGKFGLHNFTGSTPGRSILDYYLLI